MAQGIGATINSLQERARLSSIGRFWSWWSSELKDLVPGHWRERLAGSVHRVYAIASGTGHQLFFDQTEAPLFELAAGDDAELNRQQIGELLKQQDVDDPEIVMLLPDGLVLKRSISMPLAAERELKQAIRYDLDRQTPFNPDDVFFDYRVIERKPDAGQMDIELVVVPKASLGPQLSALSQAGLGVHRIDVQPSSQQVSGVGYNLLPYDQRARRVNRRGRFHLMLGIIAVILLAIVMWQSLNLRRDALSAYEAAADEARQEARLVANMTTEFEDALEAARFLNTEREKRPPVLVLLNEITRVIPDDTYLQRLIVNGCEAQLQGLSSSSQKLIELVNKSELMDGALFRGPISVDPRTNRERFNLVATIECVGEEDEATTG